MCAPRALAELNIRAGVVTERNRLLGRLALERLDKRVANCDWILSCHCSSFYTLRLGRSDPNHAPPLGQT
jgi:hypothetical protein